MIILINDFLVLPPILKFLNTGKFLMNSFLSPFVETLVFVRYKYNSD